MKRQAPSFHRRVTGSWVVIFFLASLIVTGAGVLIAPGQACAKDGWKALHHRHDPLVQAAIAVKNKYARGLMAHRDVLGSGVGVGADGIPVIKVYAARHGVPGIPERLESLPVQVEVTGMIKALGSTTARYRPAPIGVSTGHYQITAGTIGARVKNSGGTVFALSNNHVYANSNRAKIGDPVLQPGPYDGGTVQNDTLGTLYAYVPLDFSYSGENYVDAALALPSTGSLGNATLPDGYGTPGSEIAAEAIGLDVQKYGRTTGLTRGEIVEIDASVEVCYEVWFDVLCVTSAYFYDQIAIGPAGFSAGGDSGSLIVTADGNKPIGLLFAGSTERTFANPIDRVLAALNVSIDDSPAGNNPPAANFTYSASGLAANFSDTSTDSDGSIAAWSWNFGDGAGSAIQNPSHTYAAAGTYTVSLTVTDDDGAQNTASKPVTVGASVHVGDLDGSRILLARRQWRATVTILAHNASHKPVSGATVSGTWNAGGAISAVSCKTGSTGKCSLVKDKIDTAIGSVTFSVTGLVASGAPYDKTINHDPDGDSNGTSITIKKP